MSRNAREIPGPQDEYDPESVIDRAEKKLQVIDNIQGPLKVKVLNAANNLLVSFTDIQLW